MIPVQIGSELLAGPTTPGPGAVLVIGGRGVELDPDQCRRLAKVLVLAAHDPNPRKVT